VRTVLGGGKRPTAKGAAPKLTPDSLLAGNATGPELASHIAAALTPAPAVLPNRNRETP
jgi:hypothetical protein